MSRRAGAGLREAQGVRRQLCRSTSYCRGAAESGRAQVRDARSPSPGAAGPTLESLVATLKQEVAIALIRREGLSFQQTPSEQTSIKISPLAPVALVPFAYAQIDTMAATLEQLPTVTGPSGTATQGDPTPAVNFAVNSILNAIAETSIHPLLFNQPSDFYLNPYVTFTTTFSGAPASTAPGYFIRGPQGTILPGGTLHPDAPN